MRGEKRGLACSRTGKRLLKRRIFLISKGKKIQVEGQGTDVMLVRSETCPISQGLLSAVKWLTFNVFFSLRRKYCL